MPYRKRTFAAHSCVLEVNVNPRPLKRTVLALDSAPFMDVISFTISAEALEAIAARAAELLREQAATTAPQRWLGSKAAASYLGCSVGRLHNLTSAGTIPHHHEGGRLIFSTRELDDWITSGRSARSSS